MTYGGWQEDCQPLPVCMTEKARPSTAPAKLPFSGPHHPDIKKDGRPPVERLSVLSLQIPSLHNAGKQIGGRPSRARCPILSAQVRREDAGLKKTLPHERATARQPAGLCPLATKEPYGHRQQRATARQPAGLCPLATPGAVARQQGPAIARRSGGRCRRRAARALRAPCRGRPPYGVR